MEDCEEGRVVLTDSSGDESDGRLTRFEESSRWKAEMEGRATETEPAVPEDVSNEEFVKGALATLDMLDEKGERVSARLEQIKVRVKELGEKKK
jgi:hypothetical protein